MALTVLYVDIGCGSTPSGTGAVGGMGISGSPESSTCSGFRVRGHGLQAKKEQLLRTFP